MKKILVIGDANSIFIKQYVEGVLCKNGYEVILIREGFLNEDFLADYRRLGVHVESRDVGLVSKIPIVRTVLGVRLWCKKIKKKYGKMDVVHVHGLNRFRGAIGNRIAKAGARYVLSVWGDEILRGDDRRRASFRRFYDRADVITMATSHVHEAFLRAYRDEYSPKIRTCRFGLSVFDKIEQIEKTATREELFAFFGLSDSEKLTVLVGYNGREQQNLIPLTKVLQALPEELHARIVAVYTLSYGKRSEEYDAELKREMEKLPCEKLVITSFMNEDTAAKLRCISDVMLHAQPTDAFSASMQECLYCGAMVFNGAWLTYRELEEVSIKILNFADYGELSSKLPDYLLHYRERIGEFQGNRAALRALSSQEATEQAWLAAIGDC